MSSSQQQPSQGFDALSVTTGSFGVHTQTTSAQRSLKSGDSVPQRIGKYQILGLLGTGNMGEVYLAQDHEGNRRVALKVPQAAILESDAALLRFRREAEAIGRLRHRNICPLFEFGEANGRAFIAMGYVEGKPLSHYLRGRKRQPSRQIAVLFRKLAQVLEYSHQEGIVHRDLKPANIMIDQEHEPVIMDFGLAYEINAEEQTRLTQTGIIIGTPAYMSPEQIRGSGEGVTAASDIYSLGLVLFEALTGELPYKGTMAALFGQILTQDPLFPSYLNPDVDETLELICLKMMAKEPSDRFASMGEVQASLADYLRGKPVRVAMSAWDELPLIPSMSGKSWSDVTAENTSGESAVSNLPRSGIQKVANRSDEVNSSAAPWTLFHVLLVFTSITFGILAITFGVLALDRHWQVEMLSEQLQWQARQQAKPVRPIPDLAVASGVESRDQNPEVPRANLLVQAKPSDVPPFGAASQGNTSFVPPPAMRMPGVEAKLPEIPAAVPRPEQSYIPLKPQQLSDSSRAQLGMSQPVGPQGRPASGALPRVSELRTQLIQMARKSQQHVPAPGQEFGFAVSDVLIVCCWCPPGKFKMGASASNASHPDDLVTISRGFFLSQTECTQRLFHTIMQGHPLRATPDARLPVTNVSRADAFAFCSRLSQLLQSSERRIPEIVVTLPTEAQWEYACRAGSDTEFGAPIPSEAELEQFAHFGKRSAAYPVASRRPNSWNLFDMHGNVHEWCLDKYQPELQGKVNPFATEGEGYVFRGGATNSTAVDCRCSSRFQSSSGDGGTDLGFRFLIKLK
jgi:serine/threonine protein kinase/formylglycine-generating enzyme required for sulfatase activity